MFKLLRTSLLAALLAVLLLQGQVFPGAGKQPELAVAEKSAEIAVPKGHPRVYIRAEELSAIRAKVEMPEYAESWKAVQKHALPGAKSEAGPLCNAFIYLIKGDKEEGRRAVTGALQALKESTNPKNAARTLVSPLHWGACVYDWCYDLLTPEEKKQFVFEFQRIAALHPPWFPAKDFECLAVVGHDSEGWLLTGQLQAGAAIYDEDKVLFDAALALFKKVYIGPRNYHYASHNHHQGAHYSTRLVYDLYASWLFRKMGAEDVLSREQQFVSYPWIYNLRPDGEQINRGEGSFTGRSGRKYTNVLVASAYYDDPYLYGMTKEKYFKPQCPPMEEVFDIIFRPVGQKSRPFSELPLVKNFPFPMGEMTARTGWNMGKESGDVLVFMRAGGTFFGNHQRRDMGTFQIYYKTPLTGPSGYYGKFYGDKHWVYAHETIASNGLLIYDPKEVVSEKQHRAGGQIIPNGEDHPFTLEDLLTKGYEQGKVTGSSFGPDPMKPEYAAIAGDITKAYGQKAGLVTRSMATLFTEDARYPALLFIYDRLTAAQADFKKIFVLHSYREMFDEGKGSWSSLGFGEHPSGKMNLQMLLPEETEFKKIGGPGKEFWLESTGKNYTSKDKSVHPEAYTWRLEVSPKEKNIKDEFLSVITVMDADMKPVPAKRIQNGSALGIQIMNRAVIFNKSLEPAARLEFLLTFEKEGKLLILGLAPGFWRVSKDGVEIQARSPVTSEGGSLYLNGSAGKYILERVEAVVPVSTPDFWDKMRKK